MNDDPTPMASSARGLWLLLAAALIAMLALCVTAYRVSWPELVAWSRRRPIAFSGEVSDEVGDQRKVVILSGEIGKKPASTIPHWEVYVQKGWGWAQYRENDPLLDFHPHTVIYQGRRGVQVTLIVFTGKRPFCRRGQFRNEYRVWTIKGDKLIEFARIGKSQTCLVDH